MGGALAPIIATALLSSYDSSVLVSVYAAVVLAVTVLCVLVAKETARTDLAAGDTAFRAGVEDRNTPVPGTGEPC